MKVKHDQRGFISFEFVELLELMSDESKAGIIESLSCEDAIVKHVADQIIDGWTENYCSGGRIVGEPTPVGEGTPLDRACRRIAKSSDKIARKEIGRLEDALERERERSRKVSAEAFRLREMLEARGVTVPFNP